MNVPQATDSKEFVEFWTENINQLYPLAYRLPTSEVPQFQSDVERLREYVKIASDHTYGEKQQ